MALESDLLKRLVVACETGYLSPDLRGALLELLIRVVDRKERIAARDEAIRRAGDRIPGSIEHKADTLRPLILGANRGKNEEITAPLRLAARFGELPNSTRQIRRILTYKPLKCQINP